MNMSIMLGPREPLILSLSDLRKSLALKASVSMEFDLASSTQKYMQQLVIRIELTDLARPRPLDVLAKLRKWLKRSSGCSPRLRRTSLALFST